MYSKFGEEQTCSSEGMIADRQTHRQTDRHAHHNTPLSYQGGVIKVIKPELSVGLFCVTQSNATHQLTDPAQHTRSGKIWIQPNTTSKFNFLVQPNSI